LSAFFNTVRELAGEGKLVILVGKIPTVPGYDRFCVVKALSYPLLECPNFTSVPSKEIVEINAQLRRFAAGNANVRYFDATPCLCPNGVCPAFDSTGTPIYFDSSHLMMAVSWDLGTNIWKAAGVPFPFTLIRDWPSAYNLASKSGMLSAFTKH
jgi:hypothetical protein